MKKRKSYNPNDCSINWRYTSAPGTLVAEFFYNTGPQPIGNVWYRYGCDDETIEILGSYVQDTERRKGIRTAIHQWMVSAHPKIRRFITAQSTRYSKPWLLKMGFKRIRDKYWEMIVR
jgi:hypothetical protein